MGSINDDLMSGGLLQAALISTDDNGNVLGLMGPGGAYQLSKKLQAAMRPLVVADQPMRIFVAGDSTGDATDEWAYLLAVALAAKYPDHTHDYRVYNETTEQYDQSVRLNTGRSGAAHCDTGLGASSWRYQIADSAAISKTGDHDLRTRICLNGSLPSADMNICGKFTTSGNQRSYRWALNAAGTMTFTPSSNGTENTARTSTAALSGSDLTDIIWLRVTYDVDNGASGNTVTFYKSADGSTWTQIGDPVVTATASSVFDSTAMFQWIGSSAGQLAQQDHAISFYEFQAFASLTGADRFIDINVGDGLFRSDVFVDRCGNSVTLNGADANGVAYGSPALLFSNGSVGGANVDYHSDETRYPKLVHGKPSVAIINHGHNATTDLDYSVAYKVLTDALIATNRDIAICCLTQNQRSADATYVREHRVRMRQIADFCVSQDFDLIDTWRVMPTSMLAEGDTIHPGAVGKAVQSRFVNNYFGLPG